MTKKQIWILISLLLTGLIFSSLILFQFNLHNGFVFSGWKFNFIPYPFFDYAQISSTEEFLTSTIIGYLFLLGYGLTALTYVKNDTRKRFLYFGFIILCLYSIYVEGSAMISDIKGEYFGQHLWNGPVLFLFGLLLMYPKKR
jgi:hypothetical protein